MPGAVPLDDLPDELRGKAVPAEDLPDAPAPVTGGGPQRSRVYVSPREKAYRDATAAWKGQAGAAGGVLDFTTNALVNTPTDVVNSAANLGAAALDPWVKLLGGKGDLEARSRATNIPRIPLLSQAGERVAGDVAGIMPDFLKKPLVSDALTVGGALLGARGSGLLPEGPVLNDFSRNVASLRGNKPYQSAPVADVAQRYTVVPEDVQHSAGMPTQSRMTGSTRAGLGPQVGASEVPVKNIRVATQRATQDLPAQLLDTNGRVDQGLLRNAIDEQSVPYQQVATLPPPAANTLAARVRDAWQARGGSLKGDAVAESRLLPLMDENAAALPTDQLLARWKEVNGYASDLRKQVGEGSAAAQIKSQDLRAISNALLDEVDSRAQAFGNPQLTGALKEARTNLARLHTLDDSLDSVGWVDPAKLVAAKNANVPLTGGLAEVANDAAAAPRSLRNMNAAINSQDSQLDRFGREPSSFVRNILGHMGGNKLARRGIESLNQELRAGSGLLQQPPTRAVAPPLMGPNAGPAPAVPPPSAPPGLFADEIAPRGGAGGMPSAGRPEPGALPFNQLLADQMAGDLQLEGVLPPAPIARAPQGRPLDTVDFTRGEPPAAPGSFLDALTQDQLRLAEQPPDRGNMFTLEDQPLHQMLGEPPPRTPQFGPGDEFPELSLAPDGGPASPRFDVTEAAGGASPGLFADQFLMPGAQRIESPTGLIDYVPGEQDWRISNQFTPEAARGKGAATDRVVDLARRAQEAQVPLSSDVSITPDIARLMLKAQERGLINFDQSNALRLQQLLGEGAPALRSSEPWFQNIRPR